MRGFVQKRKANKLKFIFLEMPFSSERSFVKWKGSKMNPAERANAGAAWVEAREALERARSNKGMNKKAREKSGFFQRMETPDQMVARFEAREQNARKTFALARFALGEPLEGWFRGEKIDLTSSEE